MCSRMPAGTADRSYVGVTSRLVIADRFEVLAPDPAAEVEGGVVRLGAGGGGGGGTSPPMARMSAGRAALTNGMTWLAR